MKRRSFVKTATGTVLAFGTGVVSGNANPGPNAPGTVNTTRMHPSSYTSCGPSTSCFSAEEILSGNVISNDNFPDDVIASGSWCLGVCDLSGATHRNAWIKCEYHNPDSFEGQYLTWCEIP
jgi:hypothetical protein